MSELRINLGINPTGFQWSLLPGGDPFYTPEAILVRSDEGLNGMSRTLHRLFNNNLIPKVIHTTYAYSYTVYIIYIQIYVYIILSVSSHVLCSIQSIHIICCIGAMV